MGITMTLNEIRAFGPCAVGWEKLLAALGKTRADDEPVELAFIVKSNGVKDAVWCMRVNWFEHKALYMQFVDNCVEHARERAAGAHADAVYAADDAYTAAAAANAAKAAANAADDAYTAAAYAADAYANDAKAERNRQASYLLELLERSAA